MARIPTFITRKEKGEKKYSSSLDKVSAEHIQLMQICFAQHPFFLVHKQ